MVMPASEVHRTDPSVVDGRSLPGQSTWGHQVVDPHLVSLLDPTSFAAEQYRALRHTLEHLHGGKRLIAVTSPVDGDGKTTTAINLAGALAHAPDARILIVDLDLRAPSVAGRLGMHVSRPDLLEVILDPGSPLGDAVRQHPQSNLHVLSPSRTLTIPYEVLKAERLEQLLREACRQFTYVVVDTPPLVPVPDARLVGDLVDGIILVVGAHKTPRKLLAEAFNLLDRAKIVGLVFNGHRRPMAGYYDAYGYGRYAGQRRGK